VFPNVKVPVRAKKTDKAKNGDFGKIGGGKGGKGQTFFLGEEGSKLGAQGSHQWQEE